MNSPDDILFFGCYGGRVGHHLWAPGGLHVPHARVPDTLKPNRMDGVLAPQDAQQRERRARLHHIDGWTVVAWWDRSVDQRLGSNSAFLMRGTHDFRAALLAAGEAFPELLPRFAGLELVP